MLKGVGHWTEGADYETVFIPDVYYDYPQYVFERDIEVVGNQFEKQWEKEGEC